MPPTSAFAVPRPSSGCGIVARAAKVSGLERVACRRRRSRVGPRRLRRDALDRGPVEVDQDAATQRFVQLDSDLPVVALGREYGPCRELLDRALDRNDRYRRRRLDELRVVPEAVFASSDEVTVRPCSSLSKHCGDENMRANPLIPDDR